MNYSQSVLECGQTNGAQLFRKMRSVSQNASFVCFGPMNSDSFVCRVGRRRKITMAEAKLTQLVDGIYKCILNDSYNFDVFMCSWPLKCHKNYSLTNEIAFECFIDDDIIGHLLIL